MPLFIFKTKPYFPNPSTPTTTQYQSFFYSKPNHIFQTHQRQHTIFSKLINANAPYFQKPIHDNTNAPYFPNPSTTTPTQFLSTFIFKTKPYFQKPINVNTNAPANSKPINNAPANSFRPPFHLSSPSGI